jgi:hypothetical protein
MYKLDKLIIIFCYISIFCFVLAFNIEIVLFLFLCALCSWLMHARRTYICLLKKNLLKIDLISQLNFVNNKAYISI